MYKTITLKTLISDSNTKPLIDKALSNYPLYKPVNEGLYAFIPSREELNTKLINHYKYRQIGFETIGRFIEELEIAMNEIMPYYNQLYKSVDVMNNIDDIFGNVDVTETFEEKTTGLATGSTKDNTKTDTNINNSSTASSTSETTSSVNNSSKSVKSETPQNDVDVSGMDSMSYADEVGVNKTNSDDNAKTTGTDTTSTNSKQNTSSDSTQSVNSETAGTTTHTLTKQGNQGVNTYAHDMLEFRELFTNIEQQIINDLRIKELFLLVF